MLPLLLLFLIATAFSSEGEELDDPDPRRGGHERHGDDLHVAGLQRLVYRREEGILKRSGHAHAGGSYLGGMIGSAVLNALAPGAAGDRRSATSSTAWSGRQDWLLVAGFTMLGVVCFGSLGIAFAHAIPNVDSAPA